MLKKSIFLKAGRTGRNGVVATKTLRGNCGDLCEDVTVFTLKEMNEEISSPK